MTSAAKPYHHGALEQALVDEAVRQVRRRGTDQVSLRGIAQIIGVSPSAAYQHFPDKAALLQRSASPAPASSGAAWESAVAAVPDDGSAGAVARFMESAARTWTSRDRAAPVPARLRPLRRPGEGGARRCGARERRRARRSLRDPARTPRRALRARAAPPRSGRRGAGGARVERRPRLLVAARRRVPAAGGRGGPARPVRAPRAHRRRLRHVRDHGGRRRRDRRTADREAPRSAGGPRGVRVRIRSCWDGARAARTSTRRAQRWTDVDGTPSRTARIGLLVVAVGTAWGAVTAAGGGHDVLLVAAPAVAATNARPMSAPVSGAAPTPPSARPAGQARVSRDRVRTPVRPARRHVPR